MLHRRLVNPLFIELRDRMRAYSSNEEILNSSPEPGSDDEFLFRSYGHSVTIDELGDEVASSDESGVISEFAYLLDADITILK